MTVVDRAATETQPWIIRSARLGFAAKALVYLLIGVIAALVATGQRSHTRGSRGVLAEIVGKPFGRVLLFIIAVGLFGYLAWRIIDAIKDASHRGNDKKGIALRVTTAVKGLAYGGLGAQTLHFAIQGFGSGASDDHAPQKWTGRVMDWPFGQKIAIVAGLVIIGYAIYQLFNAARGKLSRDLWLTGLSEDVKRMVIGVSRFGIAARGVVFAIIGYLVVIAAKHHDPAEARGIAGALETLRARPYGSILLLVISAGLIAYAAYQFVNARYRQIRVE